MSDGTEHLIELKNHRSHHKGTTGGVPTGDQRLLVLCHCQLGLDIPHKCELEINPNTCWRCIDYIIFCEIFGNFFF